MTQKNKQIFDPEQIKLLRESLNPMTLAQHVYNTTATQPPPGWKIVASADPPGKDLNGFFARVYEKLGPLALGEPRYAVAFRGTNSISDARDMDADLRIAFRKLPGQHKQGLAFVERVCRENNINPAELEYTGHSLGGYLAITIGTVLGAKKIWAFNSPGPTRQIRDELARQIPGISKPPCKGLVQIRSAYDVIARWGYREGIIIDVNTAGENHNLGNLRTGVEAVLNNQPLKPSAPAPRKFSLTWVFNSVSRALAQSRIAGAVIRRLVNNGPPSPPKPPDCSCG